LDTFTDSNVRERCPYEADGFVMSRSYWALRSEREFVRHSTRFIINNPTWPTEWKQYSILLTHAHYMQTGDISIADEFFDVLVNNTMLPFIDAVSNLVNFTNSMTDPMGKWIGPLFDGNSPICHNSTGVTPAHITDGGKSCDNIDWLPKFRAGYKFSPTSTIINAFAVKSLVALAALANATSRVSMAAKLSTQADQTRAAMLNTMWSASDGMWCDGVCSDSYHGKSMSPGTFHSQHYALYMGVTPDEHVPVALEYLKAQGMLGSTYSANSLVHGLFDRAHTLDYGQAALDLMTQCTDHSWCHMLRLGASTTWEHWYPHDGTHSHPWSSTPASAIAEGLMGIKPTTPGWSTWIAKPAPGNLTSVAIAVPTPRGSIMANFSKTTNQTQLLTALRLKIPAGTEATVCMPLYGVLAAKVTLKLDGMEKAGRVDDSGVRKGMYLCLDGLHGGKTDVHVECSTQARL